MVLLFLLQRCTASSKCSISSKRKVMAQAVCKADARCWQAVLGGLVPHCRPDASHVSSRSPNALCGEGSTMQHQLEMVSVKGLADCSCREPSIVCTCPMMFKPAASLNPPPECCKCSACPCVDMISKFDRAREAMPDLQSGSRDWRADIRSVLRI